MNRRRLPALLLALALLLSLAACDISWLSGPSPAPADGLAVHFIDVGQGDCELVGAQGHYLLIDAGERGSEDRVIKYLRKQGVEYLDYVVATHPHSDHMGGLAYGVLAAFPVGTVIAPRFSPENTPATLTYGKFLDAVTALAAEGTKAKYARPGDAYPLGEASFTILGPLSEDGKNYNNDSVVLRVEYRNSAALFMGDAEKTAEAALVAEYGEGLRADLLKAGHHGSKTSSNEDFLRAVMPEGIVISCGVGNSYGHPSPEVLARCGALGIRVRRTDTEGTVVVIL
ncbi:MAG: MBL fold metallo-hydrolase [Oscillospiraceae bacterium]|jgi:beta-lactamase superfamily II metal-dependent hydrolase|nr:MBL fold metallo-hydrolase [Oscillospiraceae bacterium]